MNCRLSSGVLSIGLLVVSVALAHAQGFTTNANGFTGPSGQAWNAHGVNVDLTDAMQNLQGIEKNYPGTTFVRIVSYADKDTVANIAPVVQAYTSKGIAVELEDHGDSQGGANTGWYNSLAGAFKSNPLVLLETPNEPSGSAQSVSQAQISVIQAIRAAGFTNPIGVQPICCEDQSNIPLVTAAVGTSQLYVTPHIYGSPWQQGQIDEAKANGLPTIVDEFGNATDGQNIDAQGQATVDGVIAANQAGLTGAAIWAAGNGYHPDGSDSLFTDPTGSGLTSLGQDVQSWLSGTHPTPPSSAGSITSSATTMTGSVPASCQMSQSQLDGIAATTWNQVQSDSVPECGLNGSGTGQKGTGSCVPVTLAPGDVLPGDGSSVTDAQGNTWALSTPQQDGNGHWYGAIVFNGQPADPGYYAALRQIGGTVYAEEAKGAGWQIADPSNPGDNGNSWTYAADPGASTACGGGNSMTTLTPAATKPSSEPVANANIPAAGPAPSCQVPSSTPASSVPPPGSISPGSGSITANGGSYTIDTGSNEVMRNGSPATPNGSGSQTSAVTTIDGVVYGQDENTTQWFQLQPDGTGWTPLQSLPTSGQAIAPTSRWSTPPSPATAQGIAASDGAAGTMQQTQSSLAQQQSILCELQAGLARLMALQASSQHH